MKRSRSIRLNTSCFRTIWLETRLSEWYNETQIVWKWNVCKLYDLMPFSLSRSWILDRCYEAWVARQRFEHYEALWIITWFLSYFHAIWSKMNELGDGSIKKWVVREQSDHNTYDFVKNKRIFGERLKNRYWFFCTSKNIRMKIENCLQMWTKIRSKNFLEFCPSCILIFSFSTKKKNDQNCQFTPMTKLL